MKKSIYLAAIAAIALSACSSDNDSVFDQSAADRLEQYKKDYADVLTDEGGLWTMEYFSNEEEPGYLFVMKFNKNGSVDMAANHKWIGNEYREETSLWKMIADNGPVLSFNSYNKLFHIFADPANIEGDDAPKGEMGDDINETGYGHEGDYEFQVMEVSEDNQTVRLSGKKYLHAIYLHRLDSTTNVQTYMNDYKNVATSLFCKEIPNLIFKDSDGTRYVVNGAHTGVMSIYPEDGDAVEQTRKSSFIITDSGIRFIRPFEIVDAHGNEKTLTGFSFVGNHSLASVDDSNAVISAGTISEVINNNKNTWKVDLKSVTGSVSDAVNAFVEQLKTLYKYKSAAINDLSFEYNLDKQSYILKVNIKISSKSNETDSFYVDFSEADGGLCINIGEAYDNNSQLALNAYTTLGDLFKLLSSAPLKYSTVSDCGPNSIVLDANGGTLTINAQ